MPVKFPSDDPEAASEPCRRAASDGEERTSLASCVSFGVVCVVNLTACLLLRPRRGGCKLSRENKTSGQAALTRSVVQTVPGGAVQGRPQGLLKRALPPGGATAPMNGTPVGLFTSM